MSGLVATDPTSNTPILNDGWWPNVDTATARAALRIDGTVTESRLRNSLIIAMLSVNDSLQDFQSAQVAAGFDSLAKVPAPKIDGESRYVALYLRAVHSSAHADLVERYRNLDTTSDGQRKVEEQTTIIDDQRRNASWAISDILGVGRTTVELI